MADKNASKTKLDRAKDVVNERFRASKKIVNQKKQKWDVWEKMYQNKQLHRRIIGESNLVLPKADYISETISAKVINAIFGVEQWLTMRHHKVDEQTLRKQQEWFMWVMDRRVNFYLTSIELFKAAPIKGTAICKIYMRNFWPYVEFMPLEMFYPDVLANKPGDIQSMRYCMHQFKRDLNQIKRFVNSEGEPIYLNIDELEKEKESKMTDSVKMTGVDEVSVSDKVVPIYDIIEYHGDFEYEKGKFEEYIITGTLSHKDDNAIDTIIRCEPSQFKVRDKYADEDVYLKPFVSSIYAVNPGEFYGKSAISSVESLINEQTDLHNIYMDNHKRLVNGVTKVLNRTDLTRDDLPQTAGAMWYLDSFDDVEVETPPETNLVAYKQIHELLDREIEKASSVTSYNTGVGRSKRETYGEIRSMLNEAADRFQLFIQMADRLTLRPIAQRVYALLRQSFDLWGEKDFTVNGEEIGITKDDLLEDMDVQFAATTVESEHSKYSKQQTLPQFLQVMSQIAGERLNVDAIVNEFGELYNYKDPGRFLHPGNMIPIEALPPELQPIAAQILQQMQQGNGSAGQPSLPQAPVNPPTMEEGGF
jgi:hypothetical protein